MAQAKFDNINTKYDLLIEKINHTNDLLSTQLEIIEEQGHFAGSSYFDEMIKTEKTKRKKAKKEYDELVAARDEAVNSGAIKKYSEAWYEMTNAINEADSAWQEATLQVIKYKNEMREMDWSIFEKTQDYIGEIIKESQFLIDLMGSNEVDLFDKDTGKFTDKGNASRALHAMNYDTYMAEADEYGKKVKEINSLLAKDPNNTKLIDKRNEYLESQREAIKNANEEKKAVQDLVSKQYDKMLEALQKLINKRKEYLQAQKDVYDYEKNIEEQTKTIAKYQKQLTALRGDDSEEAMSKRQQINNDLKDAQKQLEETEYEKWLSDQEQLMDKMYSEYEEYLNGRLDEINELLTEAIDYANENASNISATITSSSKEVGYNITTDMKNIWDNTKSGVGKVLSEYNSNFLSKSTTLNEYVKSIKQMIEKATNTKATTSAPSTSSSSNKTSSSSSSTNKTSTSTSSNKSTSTSSGKKTLTDAIMKGIAASIWVDGSSSSGWGTGNTRISRIDSKFGSGAGKKVQDYINAHYNELYNYWIKTLKGDSSKFHYQRFNTGGFTGNSEGFGFLDKKERILTAQQTKAFDTFVYKVLPDIANVMSDFAKYSNVQKAGGDGANVENLNLTLNLPNVKDSDDFIKELQTNKKLQQVVQSITLDKALGKNSLRKFKV